MRVLLFLFFGLLLSHFASAQYVIIPEGDTLFMVAGNGTITDISGNYMGKFESDGSVYNGQDLLIGKIDVATGKIYNSLNDEIASYSSGQVLDFEQTIISTTQNNSVYDGSAVLLGTYTSLDPLKAIFLLIHYF